MTKDAQFITLLLGILVFMYCTVSLLADGPVTARLSSADGVRLKTMDPTEVIQYIQRKKFDPVDIVLLPPFVMDGDNNLTVVSVLRFMPWFRRMHIFDPTHEESKNPAEYWKTHQNAKFVMFNQDLLEYSLVSPFLEERFIVLRPLHVLSNYVFMWQFFIDDSPVIRSCRAGVIPLTRGMFNECVYAKQILQLEAAYNQDDKKNPKDKFMFAVQKGIQDGRIRFVDNIDRFVPPCSSAAVTTVKHVGPTYKPDEIRDLLQFEEVKKDRTRPFKIVLCLIAAGKDDLLYRLPKKYESVVQVWVNLTDAPHPVERLAFTHRMIVSKNVFIELPMKSFGHVAERIGAEVMKRVSELSREEKFQVLEVFSYGKTKDTKDTPFAVMMGNEVGNKLARAYNTPFATLSSEEPVADSREWMRLRHL